MQAMQDEGAATPTQHLKKPNKKNRPKVGVLVKRTYAGVNKSTSKLASSFRKDVPELDADFEREREEFEQLVQKVSSLHKRVRRYNKTFSDMGRYMLDLAEVLQTFGAESEDKQFGDNFMKAAESIDRAASSFSSGVQQADQDLKAFRNQLKQYSKQIERRDAALSEFSKVAKKREKIKKRPEDIRYQQSEAHYEEVKQVYSYLNEEIKQQLQAYNTQRMQYIMPQLQKLSECHVGFLKEALSGSEALASHHTPRVAEAGLSPVESHAGLQRRKTEGDGLIRPNARTAFKRLQSNPELREVEPLIYRCPDDDEEGENEDEGEKEQERYAQEENIVPSFKALSSPATLHASTVPPKEQKRNKKKKGKKGGGDISKKRERDATSDSHDNNPTATSSEPTTRPLMEKRPSFRRPSDVHPPAKPTPPVPHSASLTSSDSSLSSSSSLSKDSSGSEDSPAIAVVEISAAAAAEMESVHFTSEDVDITAPHQVNARANMLS